MDHSREPSAPGRRLARAGGWAPALAVVGLVVALDQLTKQVVISHVERGEPVDVVFGIQITNARNKGVAFGLFGDGGDLVLALTVVTLVLVGLYFTVHAQRRGLWLAVGLVVGGALGNLADRARIGAAIDFLDPPRWPAFNLADVAIVIGVVLLALLVTTHDDDGSRRA